SRRHLGSVELAGDHQFSYAICLHCRCFMTGHELPSTNCPYCCSPMHDLWSREEETHFFLCFRDGLSSCIQMGGLNQKSPTRDAHDATLEDLGTLAVP